MLDGKQEGKHPLAIANRFVEKAAAVGRPLSILHLVKLVYLAHGWCLGYTGKPLISSPVQAWRHGPVIPEVYNEFRPQGIHNIMTTASDENGNVYKAALSEREEDILNQVYDAYSPLSASRLSALTHAEDSPWSRARGYYAPIPDNAIRAYYEKRAGKSEEAKRG